MNLDETAGTLHLYGFRAEHCHKIVFKKINLTKKILLGGFNFLSLFRTVMRTVRLKILIGILYNVPA